MSKLEKFPKPLRKTMKGLPKHIHHAEIYLEFGVV